jgi:pimeloyl-ACP methyl ester carboxylesterase
MRDFKNWNFRIDGEGAPVLLINGHFQSRSSWDPIASDLSRYNKILTCEFPNQGISATDVSLNKMQQYAEFIEEFLRYVKISPSDVIVYGFSFAGNVIRYLSQDMGIQFKAIIYGGIASGKFFPFQIRRFETWLKILDQADFDVFMRNLMLQVFSPAFIANNGHQFDELVNAYERYYSHRPEALKALIHALIDFCQATDSVDERYAEPIHIIGAESDLIMPANYVQDYGRSLNAASIHILPGGHSLRVEQEEALSSVIHEICASYD